MAKKNVLIGFDGFIDTIVRAVDHYENGNKIYIRFIEQFGQRISMARGRSTNIELDVICKKIGGNGPILSDAMNTLGAVTTCIGTLGDTQKNIFKSFAQRNVAFSVGLPGETRAIEFEDGKILLGEMYDTAKIDANKIRSICGRDNLQEIVSKNELLCFVNWTMLLNMNNILEFFLSDILEKQADHMFFFDLADPAKREKEDVVELINYIRKFSCIGETILGLNLSEAQHILRILGFSENIFEREESISKCARMIRDKVGCQVVFIHANSMSAGCADKSAFVTGYFSEFPKISTGAGDHFNAGFLFDYLENRDIESALHMGSAVSKYYVDYVCSPDISQASSVLKL